ncbi:MAG: AMP-binding protein [Acidobacteriota bacterium]|nr:AMP-binding protein [Acidobacteriota bacterium]
MPRDSLAQYFQDLRRWGSGTAYVHHRGYRWERWSYRRVADTAARFARLLESRGVARGDRVVVWGENCAEWGVAFVGCVLRGAVVVPMDKVATPDFVRRVAEQVDAKLVISSRELPEIDVDLPRVTLPRIILEDLAEVVAEFSAESYSPPPLSRADTLEIVFTSGTTADPKGVVISHGNVLANLEPLAREIAKYSKWERWFHPIRFLNLLPLSHVFGQFLGVFVPQLIGGTVLFQDTLNPTEVLQTVRKERVSVVVAVPRMLQSLADKIERDVEAEGKSAWLRRAFERGKEQKFLRRWLTFRRIHRKLGWKFWAFISGGAALDAETEEFWRRLGYAVIQGYGLTETTSLISVNHPFKLAKGAIGKVLPGRELKLADDGEILVRGENLAAGYWQGKQFTPVLQGEDSRSEDAGWFRTGDVGALDAEGNLFFKGRKKNVIVTPAGMNVFPDDLEGALRRQPEVRDCVVIGLERGGNAEPCAVLLLGHGEAAEVVKRANGSLAEYQQMHSWYVWPEQDFPRTSTQKPRTNLIAAQAQAGLLKTYEPAAASDKATAPEQGALAELIAHITGRPVASFSGALGKNAKLEGDLNLSSLDRVELMSAIEDRYQLDLNESGFAAATTVGELEKMLREQPAFGSTAARTDYEYPRWAQRWPFTWIRPIIYYLLTWPATMLMNKPKVIGRENLRELRGPALVISNHVAYLDVGFILYALPPRLRNRLATAMEGEQLRVMRHPGADVPAWRRPLKKLSYFLTIALFNVFPLPKTTGFREAFAYAGESADRGYSVLIFPEGVRTTTGEMAKFRSGIGLLANRLGLPIIPMRIEDLFPLKVRKQRFARPGTIKVRIGKPVRFPPGTDPEQIAKDLQQIVEYL